MTLPVTTDPTNDGAPWSLDEYVVVADLWLQRGRSSGITDPDVRILAELTQRTAASISRRLGNFEGTAHPGRGLKPVAGEALALFRAMQADAVFRQRVVEEARRRLQRHARASGTARTVRTPRLVDPENAASESVEVRTDAAVRQMLRVEADLVRRYRTWLDISGRRLRGILIPVGDHILRVDLYDIELDLLIEAKSAATRELIREAIGQLFDYRRYLAPRPRLAVLLPERPPGDLSGLLREANIEAIWAEGEGFADCDGGRLASR